MIHGPGPSPDLVRRIIEHAQITQQVDAERGLTGTPEIYELAAEVQQWVDQEVERRIAQ